MKNIALLQTAFLGDLLLTLPLVKRLRSHYPTASIHMVARKGFEEVLLGLGLVDFFYSVDKSRVVKGVHSLPPCDLLISPHQSLSTARQARAVQAPIKIGYRKWWNGFVFSDRVVRPMHLPEALRTLALLGPLDEDLRKKISSYEAQSLDSTRLRPVPEWASMALPEKARHLLERVELSTCPRGPFIVMAPGSVWATKRWRKEGFVGLARLLQRQGYEILLTGSRQERDLGAQIAEATGAVNLCGQLSIVQSLKLMSKATAVVSNDSGAMHMASAVDTPCVAIFGPTVLGMGYQPWQRQACVVERRDLDCRPCSLHGTNRCPLGHHNCMGWIQAQDVLSAIEELTSERSDPNQY